MSEKDMLKESLTRILRPIIFEAVREAFAEQRKKPTPKRYSHRQKHKITSKSAEQHFTDTSARGR